MRAETKISVEGLEDKLEAMSPKFDQKVRKKNRKAVITLLEGWCRRCVSKRR